MPKNSPILVAEDNPDDVFLVQRALCETGVSNPLQVVNNGQEAIDYLCADGKYADREAYPFPVLFLLDLKMPVKDGLEVLEWLHAHPDIPLRLPVVVFSSDELPEETQKAYAMDVQACIVKPMGYPALRERIRILKEYWLDYESPPRPPAHPRPRVRSIEREIVRASAGPIGYLKGVTGTRHIHNLALIGFMGTGKSSVGRQLAQLLHFTFLDTDQVIEARAGKTITDIFQQDGEPAFRDWEARIVEELTHRQKTVIATGGGLPVREANLASLKTHALVVCLWASPETIYSRVRAHSHRPLLHEPDPLEKIRSLLSAREPYYRQADVLVGAELRTVHEVAVQVAHQFRAAQAAQR